MKGWRYFTTIFGDQSVQHPVSKFEPMTCEDLPGEDVSLLRNSVIANPHDQRNTKRFSKLNELIDNDDIVVTQKNSKSSNKSSSSSLESNFFSSFSSIHQNNLIPSNIQNASKEFCSDPACSNTCTCHLRGAKTDGKNGFIELTNNNEKHAKKSIKKERNGLVNSSSLQQNLILHCETAQEDSEGEDDRNVDSDFGEFHQVMRPLCPVSSLQSPTSKLSSISWPKHGFILKAPVISKSHNSAEENLIDFDI